VAKRAKSAHLRGMLLLSAAAAIVAMCAALPSTAAASENFCGVTLQPYGHNGDRCWGMGHPLFGITMVTYERAGCVDAANSNNELLGSWICAAAGSVPGPAAELHFTNDGVRRKGVIRNNNLSFTGYFAGAEVCYAEC
jgi:hypothetical protein